MCLFNTNSGRLLSCTRGSSSVIFYLVWYKTGIKGSCRNSRFQTTWTMFPEGISLWILPVSPCGPSNPTAKMLPCAISHSTVLSRLPGSQKVQNTEVGSVAYRSDYSFPPTGSSFVALSCIFSSTLYSFSILLHVSSDKRQRDYPSACKSPTQPSVRTGPPTDQQPPRATADKKMEKNLSALVYELLKNQSTEFLPQNNY